MKTTRAAFKNSIMPKSVKGGEEIEVLVSPIGTFPHPDGDQICTREAFDALVEKWREDGEPEILVDFDHASETGGATEAAAWATKLSSDDEGLHAVFRMTDKGAEALTATRYRYLSPAWYVDEEGHPTELSTIALTNRPNLPVPRLLNRKPDADPAPAQNAEAGDAHLPDPASAGEGNPPDEGNIKNTNTDMDKIKELLGLAAEATDDEVRAAVEALRAERDALKSEKDKMEAAAKEAALEKEAEDFVNSQGEKIADRDACKNAYKRDPEGTKALFNAIKMPTPPKPANPDGKPARVVDVNAAKAPDATDLLANCKNGAERMAWALRHARA